MTQNPPGANSLTGRGGGGEIESWVNYGADAPQHLGVNALGAVISPLLIFIHRLLWGPAGAGFLWVWPQLERSAGSKPSPDFQIGAPFCPVTLLSHSASRGDPGTPLRAASDFRQLALFGPDGLRKDLPDLRGIGRWGFRSLRCSAGLPSVLGPAQGQEPRVACAPEPQVSTL